MRDLKKKEKMASYTHRNWGLRIREVLSIEVSSLEPSLQLKPWTQKKVPAIKDDMERE